MHLREGWGIGTSWDATSIGIHWHDYSITGDIQYFWHHPIYNGSIVVSQVSPILRPTPLIPISAFGSKRHGLHRSCDRAPRVARTRRAERTGGIQLSASATNEVGEVRARSGWGFTPAGFMWRVAEVSGGVFQWPIHHVCAQDHKDVLWLMYPANPVDTITTIGRIQQS